MIVDISKAEPVSVPSFEEFCEMQDDDEDWWHWALESQCEYLESEYGIDIAPKDISFDLYHRECASTGRIGTRNQFVKAHYEALMSASPVLTQVLLEDMERVRWGISHRNCNVIFDYDNEYAGVGYTFTQGLFIGLDVDTLIEAEPHDNHYKWYACVEEIIKDTHRDIIKMLENEDEYRKSTEEYEEWLKANY